MKINEAIEQLGLLPDDKIFIRQYRKEGETEMIVQDLDAALLNKEIKYIQHHYGGKENNYNCYRFILQ